MKQPRTTLYCLVLAIAGWGAALVAPAVTTTDFSRYQVVLDRKPFGEVAPVAVPGTTDLAAVESFTKDYEMKAIDQGQPRKAVLQIPDAGAISLGKSIFEMVGLDYFSFIVVGEKIKQGAHTIGVRFAEKSDNYDGCAGARVYCCDDPIFLELPKTKRRIFCTAEFQPSLCEFSSIIFYAFHTGSNCFQPKFFFLIR